MTKKEKKRATEVLGDDTSYDRYIRKGVMELRRGDELMDVRNFANKVSHLNTLHLWAMNIKHLRGYTILVKFEEP